MTNNEIANFNNMALFGCAYETMINNQNLLNITGWLDDKNKNSPLWVDVIKVLVRVVNNKQHSVEELHEIHRKAPNMAKACIIATSKIDAGNKIKTYFHNKLNEYRFLADLGFKTLNENSYMSIQNGELIIRDLDTIEPRTIYNETQLGNIMNDIKKALTEKEAE